MKQELFEQLHSPEWKLFEAWLATASNRKRRKKEAPPPSPSFPAAELPQRYRMLCQHLALARDRDYSLALVTYLHRLVQAGHDKLYGVPSGFAMRALRYAAGGFAADVRANRWWVLAAALLMFGPALISMVAIRYQPDLAYLVIPPEQVAHYETMYNHTGDTILARDASTDMAMFGFYIFNNVSISFRCFAGGITAGLMSAFALIFNGLLFGVVESRLALAGLGHNFYSFVIGHAGFELGAITLSGAAGLRLGMALVVPGRRTRREALRETASSLIGMVCGLAVMLVIAALIEAFWSPLRLDYTLKLSVGSVLCLIPIVYFIFAGRDHGA